MTVWSEGTARANPPRVLVVDDDASVRATLEAQLLPMGMAITLEGDPRKALEAIVADPPDVVLLDVMMPHLDGLAICRALRAREETRRLPILIVTALDDRAQVVEGLSAGADDYLTKPVNGPELRARVGTLVRLSSYYRLLDNQRAEALAKLEQLKDQLLKVDRLASLGTFAAGVGHELGNIATVLVSSLDFINLAIEAGKVPERKDLEHLERATQHVIQHSRAMMQLGSGRASSVQSLELEAVAGNVFEMVRVSGRTRRVTLSIMSLGGPFRFSFNPVAADQVLINLLINAVDALEGTPDPRVTLELSRPAPGKIRCTISDNGPGMPPEVLARATEAFFTTKPPGKGTGLGLAVVKRLIEDAGGSLTIDTSPAGTRVSWELAALPS